MNQPSVRVGEIKYTTASVRDGRVVLEERRAHDPPHEAYAIVRPLVVGVCRSDIKELLGARSVRSDFGHELVGQLVHSRGIGDPPSGTFVTLDPHVPLAERTSAFGTLMEASGRGDDLTKALVRIPSPLTESLGVYIEPLACAHHCLSRVRTVMGAYPRTVAVVGAGTAGLLIAALFARGGSSVYVINRSEDRLRFLAELSVGQLGVRLGLPEVPVDVAVVATAMFSQGLKGLSRIGAPRVVVAFGGTSPGDVWRGLEIDGVRRSESSVVTPHGMVMGTHGALISDFESAVDTLSHWESLALILKGYVVGAVSLATLPETLSRLSRDRYVGKMIVEMGEWT